MIGLVPTIALGQEGGTVEVTIDETSYDFPLWESQSDWSGSAEWASVNIYSRPLDEDTWELFKGFTLGFQYNGGTVGSGEASLSRVIDGELVRYFADADDTEMTLTVEEASVDGAYLTLNGTAEMTMGTSDNFGRDIDMSEPLSLSAVFAVTLGPVE